MTAVQELAVQGQTEQLNPGTSPSCLNSADLAGIGGAGYSLPLQSPLYWQGRASRAGCHLYTASLDEGSVLVWLVPRPFLPQTLRLVFCADFRQPREEDTELYFPSSWQPLINVNWL